MIPALNEARNLPRVFERMPPDMHEVILVDGQSVDGTVEVARGLWPAVRIVGQARAGKGNALACGFAATTGDIIAVLDADGSADPSEIPLFVAALAAGAQFAKGSRSAPSGPTDDLIPARDTRNIGNRVLTKIFNLCYRTCYADLCHGLNAFWQQYAGVLDLDATATGGRRRWGDGPEIETLIQARVAKAGLAVTEVPSFGSARIHAVSRLSAFSDGCRVLWAILSEWRPLNRGGVKAAWEARPRVTVRRVTEIRSGRSAPAAPAQGRAAVALRTAAAVAGLALLWAVARGVRFARTSNGRILRQANRRIKSHPKFTGSHVRYLHWVKRRPRADGKMARAFRYFIAGVSRARSSSRGGYGGRPLFGRARI